MKAAFIIIDVQKGYIENPLFKESIENTIPTINETSKLFRDKKLPVIVVQHISNQFNVGDEGFEVASQVLLKDTDIRVHKTYSNSFLDTDLEEILEELAVDTVILAGFAAGYCVLFTYNGAFERGFKPFVLQDGASGKSLKSVELLYELRDVISYNAVKLLLEK